MPSSSSEVNWSESSSSKASKLKLSMVSRVTVPAAISRRAITVEDCLKRIPNRFEMVKLAAKRARQIALDGREPTIDSGDDKATVVALREIAAGTVTQDNIQEFNFDIFEEELSEQLTSDSET